MTLPFTAPQSGFMRMSIATLSDKAYWYIKSQKYGEHYSDIAIEGWTSGGGSYTKTAWFFVDKDDVLSEQGSINVASKTLWFIPLDLR